MHILSHRTTTFDRESRGAAFGRTPQGRGAPLWMFSFSIMGMLVLDAGIPCPIMRILCLFGLIFWIIMAIPPFLPARPIPAAREI